MSAGRDSNSRTGTRQQQRKVAKMRKAVVRMDRLARRAMKKRYMESLKAKA
jgi:hypothetical protein